MPILYPPHPSSKIPRHRLPLYEASGEWVAQRKFNGTHVVVHVSASRKVGILTRHGTAPKMFSLTGRHRDQILSLRLEGGKEYWFDGELLDHKTTSRDYKGKIVLFDLLQAGRYLFRSPDQSVRLEMLSDICGAPSAMEPTRGIALRVSDDIWLAECWRSGFEDRFADFIGMDEIEGLILRKASSTLENYGQKEYDVPWILRCRKPDRAGGYTF